MRLNWLKTEQQNRVSGALDKLSAKEIADLMNREDAKVSRAVGEALPEIAKGIDVICDRLGRGGRLVYVGSGTSGRIGALDAIECPPTFGTDPEMIQYMIAGGEEALLRASEDSEDSAEAGASEMARWKPCKRDVVVGLAASGCTTYTIAALACAKKKGAATIAIACNRGSELAKVSQIAIEAEVGPEVLTGSTRLKAGTAEKMICNMLTTGAMARLGYVYGNLMVNLRLKNRKLLERGISMVEDIAKVDRDAAIAALKAADMRVPVALIMSCAKTSKAGALRRLKRANGSIRRAIEASE